MNPLHLLMFGTVRSAASAMRLRNRMPQPMSQIINDQERRELCVLAQKVLDTDSSFYSNPKLKKFQWSIKGIFIWDVLICILTSIAMPGLFSPTELDAAWSNMADVYSNHQEILESKRALHIAVGRATLKAWTANPPSYAALEPGFITALREPRQAKIAKRPW
jgi:hypothetical protein